MMPTNPHISMSQLVTFNIKDKIRAIGEQQKGKIEMITRMIIPGGSGMVHFNNNTISL
jgi:hypothetical protein